MVDGLIIENTRLLNLSSDNESLLIIDTMACQRFQQQYSEGTDAARYADPIITEISVGRGGDLVSIRSSPRSSEESGSDKSSSSGEEEAP